MNNRLIRETVINYLEVLCKDGESADTKVARNEMIQGYVEDELMALNEEFRKVQANQMQKWKHSNLDIYKTEYFKKFILNNHESYSNVYKKSLKTCIINKDTIESFLTGGNTQVKTKDFFTAFINYVEKKYNHLIISDVPKPKSSVVEIKKADSEGYDNQKLNPMILGAQLINAEFFKQIEQFKFTLAEFYTGKHDDRCGWFGILNKWDIKRELYPKVYQTLLCSFDKDRKNKVAVVILGEGGSGKSIFQMRLAHDLAVLNTYKVLWIIDFEEFIKKDFNTNTSTWDRIKNDLGSNYFIFIEDWYSKVDNNGDLSSKKFLENTQKYNHIRIVVGDRDIQGKRIDNRWISNTYIEYLYDDNNRFEISLEENKYVITKVLQTIPKWEKVIKKDFNYDDLNKAPLFMFLFIIVKTSEQNNSDAIDLAEPHVAFIKIIKSNLKKLQDLNCTGIAKALYYWSFIYSTFRIQISYHSLLVLAEHFNDLKDENPLKFENLKIKSKVTEIINSFIGIRFYNELYNQKVFYFNHDILSDYGLSRVVYHNWAKYDEVMLKTILEVLTNKGPHETASIFLHRMIRLKPILFENKYQILHYIDKLIERKIKHPDYTGFLSNKNVVPLSIDELDCYAVKLFEIGHFNLFFWTYVFNKKELTAKWTSKFLKDFSISNSPQAVITEAIYFQKDRKNEMVQSICKQVLESNVLLLNPNLVISVIQNSSGKYANLVQDACKEVLLADFKEINSELVVTALKYYVNKQDGLVQSLCKQILQDNVLLLNPKLVLSAIKLISDEFTALVQSICRFILLEDILKLDPNIVIAAFTKFKDPTDRVVQDSCKKILKAYFNNSNSELFTTALKYYVYKQDALVVSFYEKVLKNSYKKIVEADFNKIDSGLLCTVIKGIDNPENELVKNICCKVLDKSVVLKHNPMLISTTFYYCNNKTIKLEIAKFFIVQKSNDASFSNVVYRSLEFFAYDNDFVVIPEFVNQYINKVITDFHNQDQQITNKEFRYYNLLKLPFHSNKPWKDQTQKILENWVNYPRITVSNVLYGYRNTQPQQVKKVCLEILKAWKKEVNVEIKTLHGHKQFANHLITAMGHPDLTNQTLLTAKQINSANIKGFKVNDYVQQIVWEIIQNKNYPNWGKKKED